MKIERYSGHAPKGQALAAQLAAMPSPCVGCDDCRGICLSLIDAILLPDLILKERAT